MKLKIKHWKHEEQKVAIQNKTVKTLSDGRVIPTWSAMLRQAAKLK
jgi:uncharacterized coiled-coil protein SlyX